MTCTPNLQDQFLAESAAAAGSRPTQNDLILARLMRTPGEWVSMPDLAEAAGCYAVHSRIADLRADGHDIPPPRMECARPRKTWYRIILPDQK